MSQQPDWLKRLAERVCECVDLLEDAPPVGCHYFENGETWEVSLFISSTEIVGGAHDGKRIAALFFTDLIRLLQVFDAVESAGWQPHRVDKEDELGAHLAVDGIFEGRRIWLRLLAESPVKFDPGRFANLLERQIVDSWKES